MHTSGFLMISAWILNSAQLWFDLCADCEEEMCKNLNIEASYVCPCSFHRSDAFTPSETLCCFTEGSSQSHWKHLLLRFRWRRQLIGRGVDQWGKSFCSSGRRAACRRFWYHQKLINLCVFWVTFTEFIKSCWSDFTAEFKGTRSNKIIKSVISQQKFSNVFPLMHPGFYHTKAHTHSFIHRTQKLVCDRSCVHHIWADVLWCFLVRTALIKQPPQRKRRFWH